AAAGRYGLSVAFAADTHLHADFLSGARQLAADVGAQILAPAAGARAFDHRGLADGDEVDLGGLTLRAWATPGHTADHVAYVLLDGPQVLGVFTGGSLLVGAAARTDLAGPEQTQPPAPAQYGSLRTRLAWAAWRGGPGRRPVIPPITLLTCCWTARRYWECSPEGRCWPARRPVPTWPARSRPSRWPGRSTGPCGGSWSCPTRRRCTP